MTEKPYCHGEPMVAEYRYLEDDIIYQTFGCNFSGCQHKEKRVLIE
jgi:hypothetical protein